MNQANKIFVVAKGNCKRSSVVLVQKDDVGIVESELKGRFVVFFIRIWKKVLMSKNDLEIFDVRKSGDGFPKKICNICHKLLSTVEFAKNQNAKITDRFEDRHAKNAGNNLRVLM